MVRMNLDLPDTEQEIMKAIDAGTPFDKIV